MSATAKNKSMANKGKAFEDEVILANEGYEMRGIANVQKISTPWQVVRSGKRIINAFPCGKSTLDFRGTVKPRVSISFDCKESDDEKGLPLGHIQEHQIEYMRKALQVKEITFLLCYMKLYDRRYLIPGKTVLAYWDTWQQNKGKRGYNTIPIAKMVEVMSSGGIVLDYLEGLEELVYG